MRPLPARGLPRAPRACPAAPPALAVGLGGLENTAQCRALNGSRAGPCEGEQRSWQESGAWTWGRATGLGFQGAESKVGPKGAGPRLPSVPRVHPLRQDVQRRGGRTDLSARTAEKECRARAGCLM